MDAPRDHSTAGVGHGNGSHVRASGKHLVADGQDGLGFVDGDGEGGGFIAA